MTVEFTNRENQVRDELEKLLFQIAEVQHVMQAQEKGAVYDYALPAVGTILELATVNNLKVEAEKLLFDFENRIKSGGRV